MVFPLVTGLFFNAIWLVVRRVFTMLRTDRESSANQENLEEVTNLANTFDLEQEQVEEVTNLSNTETERHQMTPRDLIALTTVSTEQEL